MTSNSNATQKPEATKTELSEQELAQASGGFNPQPDPPGVVATPNSGIRVPDLRVTLVKPTDAL